MTEAGGGVYWRRLSFNEKHRIECDEDNWDGGHPVLSVLITRVATWRRRSAHDSHHCFYENEQDALRRPGEIPDTQSTTSQTSQPYVRVHLTRLGFRVLGCLSLELRVLGAGHITIIITKIQYLYRNIYK